MREKGGTRPAVPPPPAAPLRECDAPLPDAPREGDHTHIRELCCSAGGFPHRRHVARTLQRAGGVGPADTQAAERFHKISAHDPYRRIRKWFRTMVPDMDRHMLREVWWGWLYSLHHQIAPAVPAAAHRTPLAARFGRRHITLVDNGSVVNLASCMCSFPCLLMLTHPGHNCTRFCGLVQVPGYVGGRTSWGWLADLLFPLVCGEEAEYGSGSDSAEAGHVADGWTVTLHEECSVERECDEHKAWVPVCPAPSVPVCACLPLCTEGVDAGVCGPAPICQWQAMFSAHPERQQCESRFDFVELAVHLPGSHRARHRPVARVRGFVQVALDGQEWRFAVVQPLRPHEDAAIDSQGNPLHPSVPIIYNCWVEDPELAVCEALNLKRRLPMQKDHDMCGAGGQPSAWMEPRTLAAKVESRRTARAALVSQARSSGLHLGWQQQTTALLTAGVLGMLAIAVWMALPGGTAMVVQL